MMIELVEDRAPQAFRADTGRDDVWLVCHEERVLCEIARQPRHGDARDLALRIAAAMNLLREIPTFRLAACVRDGVQVTFSYPEEPKAEATA